MSDATSGSFAALAALAADIAGVPVAFVAFVSPERQWIDSHRGLDGASLQVALALCRIAASSEGVIVAEDTAKDDRFVRDPLVSTAGIRFYAGFPLRTADGVPFGALCVADHAPRVLPPAVERSLASLAAHAVVWLESQRKVAELEQSRRTLDQHTRFFEISQDLFCTSDAELFFREINPSWTAVLGWSREELLEKPFIELIHPEDIAMTLREVERMIQEGLPTIHFENRYRHKSGHFVPLSWSARIEGDLCYAVARDITAQRQRETLLADRDARIAESDAQLRAVFDSMDEGVVLQGASGEITACNSSAASILGLSLEEMLGRTSLDPRWRAIREDGSSFPGEEHPALLALKSGRPHSGVVMGLCKPTGAEVWILVHSRPLIRAGETLPHAVLTSFRDITEERARTLRLAREERLVTAGTLAAGIGHEINNPLSYVTANIELSIEKLSDRHNSEAALDERLVEWLTEARRGAERIRKIVRGMRSLSRNDGPPAPTDVRGAAESALHIAMHELRQRASVSTDLPDDLCALADESRLTQVLVNLLVNAAQSFPADDPSTQRVSLSSRLEGKQVQIRISDNGPGIPSDILPRIFDPFFTTKAIGQGTGLGLSISHSIVRALSGEISCETEPGVGTTFIVSLPAAAEVRQIAQGERERRSGRVLIVDDDESVVRSFARILRGDHEVSSERDPRAARKRFERGERFDVVFCDLMMPHLTGPDLYHLAREIDPALGASFVFVTGGALRQDIDKFLASVGNERIEKPVSVEGLRSVVQRLLSRAAGEGW